MKKFNKESLQLKAAAVITLVLVILVSTLPMNIALHYVTSGVFYYALLISVGVVGGALTMMVKKAYDKAEDKLIADLAIRMYVKELLF